MTDLCNLLQAQAAHVISEKQIAAALTNTIQQEDSRSTHGQPQISMPSGTRDDSSHEMQLAAADLDNEDFKAVLTHILSQRRKSQAVAQPGRHTDVLNCSTVMLVSCSMLIHKNLACC